MITILQIIDKRNSDIREIIVSKCLQVQQRFTQGSIYNSRCVPACHFYPLRVKVTVHYSFNMAQQVKKTYIHCTNKSMPLIDALSQ